MNKFTKSYHVYEFEPACGGKFVGVGAYRWLLFAAGLSPQSQNLARE